MFLNNMILVDIETGSFDVESGIFEVALIVIKNGQIIEREHFGTVYDESIISLGMGSGYEDCSYNENFIEGFKSIINKYKFPLVAHNGSFDRKFLFHYQWLDENYTFYDSIRAIRLSYPKLFSYSMQHLIDFLNLSESQTHTAIGDVELLWKVLSLMNPTTWIPIGESIKSRETSKVSSLSSLKKDFDIIKNIFEGKTIVFTGKGPYKRNNLIELAKKCGALAENSITKRTNILVVGEDAGSKLKKAKDLGIEIIEMADFFEMVQGIDLDVDIPVEKEKVEIQSNLATLKKSDKLRGQIISLFPMKLAIATKVAIIVESHGGTPLFNLRKNETNLLVYQPYAEDFVTLEKAKKNEIPTMTLGKFNQLVLELEADTQLEGGK